MNIYFFSIVTQTDSVVTAVREIVEKMQWIIINTLAINGVVNRWSLGLLSHWAVMGSVVTCTVETSIIWV